MSNRRFILTATVATLIVSACGGQQEVQTDPQPTGPTPEEIEAARQDSIRRAEEAEAARMRAEEEARARDMARRAEDARQTLREAVYFDYDESALRSDTESRLRAKLEVLRANPGVRLRMEGHADERGTSEYNIALGNERADAVVRFLTGFGLDAERFSTVSFGEERPAMQGSNERAWAENRRVEFVITMGSDGIVGS